MGSTATVAKPSVPSSGCWAKLQSIVGPLLNLVLPFHSFILIPSLSYSQVDPPWFQRFRHLPHFSEVGKSQCSHHFWAPGAGQRHWHTGMNVLIVYESNWLCSLMKLRLFHQRKTYQWVFFCEMQKESSFVSDIINRREWGSFPNHLWLSIHTSNFGLQRDCINQITRK